MDPVSKTHNISKIFHSFKHTLLEVHNQTTNNFPNVKKTHSNTTK